jgi:hypothetical protein
MPSRIVTMIPPGSRPGIMSLAKAPTIKPMTIIQSKCMLYLLFLKRLREYRN